MFKRPTLTPDRLRALAGEGRLTRRQITQALAAAGIVTATMPVVTRPARAADSLTVFTWSGYDVPELHQPYIDKYGASPDFSLFADNDEAVEKAKAGF